MLELTQQQIDAQIDRAIVNAKSIDKKEPRAEKVFYDNRSNSLIIHFINGAIFSIPINAIEELADLDPAILAEVTLTPGCKGLRWDTKDIDLSIQGLLLGIFGSKKWMAELGRKGGTAKSDRKATAVRENGKKGGRPKTVRSQ